MEQWFCKKNICYQNKRQNFIRTPLSWKRIHLIKDLCQQQLHKKISGILNQILYRSKPVGVSLFAGYIESFHYKVQETTDSKNTTIPKRVLQPKLSEEQIENQVKSVHELKLFPEQIRFIEKSTVLQSNSIVWKSLRAGRITASNIHSTLHQLK